MMRRAQSQTSRADRTTPTTIITTAAGRERTQAQSPTNTGAAFRARACTTLSPGEVEGVLTMSERAGLM